MTTGRINQNAICFAIQKRAPKDALSTWAPAFLWTEGNPLDRWQPLPRQSTPMLQTCMRKQDLRFHCLDGFQPAHTVGRLDRTGGGPTSNNALSDAATSQPPIATCRRTARCTRASPSRDHGQAFTAADPRQSREPTDSQGREKSSTRPVVTERTIPSSDHEKRTAVSWKENHGCTHSSIPCNASEEQCRKPTQQLTTIFAFAFLPTSRPSHHTPSVLCIAFQRSGPMDRNTAWHR